MQLLAAGWHHKSEAQIARLAAEIGPSRIQVIHGTNDHMVSFPHGQELAECLGGEEAGITVRFIEGQGHVIPIEMRSEFHEWIESLVTRTEAMKPSKKENGVNGHTANGKVSNGHTNGHAS
jgi:predicted esterase